MKNIRVDESGDLRCWKCGSKEFALKRTLRSKVVLGVGALLTKKKLKCQTCGEYNDTGSAKPYKGPASKKYQQVETSLKAKVWDDDDDDDDWADRLPDNRMKRIKPLKDLISKEKDPIVRHEMVDFLTEDLYRLREERSSILDDFDDLVEKHHSELMNGLRQKIISAPNFSGWLYAGFYKQASIRYQKVEDFTLAKKWAERGVWFHDKYGTDLVMEDLRNRVEKLSSRLADPG